MDLGNAVVIIGGGPVGLVSALSLAERGHEVHVFEARTDPRKVAVPRGRSIALTLTERGWTALRRAGVEDRIRKISVPLRGREIHLESGETRYQPYGVHGEAIDCVSRPDLTAELLDVVEQRRDIHMHFGWRCLLTRPEEGAVLFDLPDASPTTTVRSRKILAADGSSSGVRSALLTRGEFELHQTYSRHFYKELSVPLKDNGRWPFEPNALHLWPRGDCMLAAFASPQHGFTCTLFMPMEGERSFSALAQPRDLHAFFEAHFTDLLGFMPQLQRDFYTGAPSNLISVKCYPWVFGGLALIGDAAHAMFPFLGQGLNAGLEDITVLLECLTGKADDWNAALLCFQTMRKPNCDAVTDIAAQHYQELAQATRDPRFVLRKRLEVRLGELFPEDLASPYHIVSFSNRPYLDARRAATLQRRVIDRLLPQADLEQALESGGADGELIRVARSVLASGTHGQ